MLKMRKNKKSVVKILTIISIFGLFFSAHVSYASTTIGADIMTNGDLTVDGAVQFTSGAVAGSALVSDASGNASWTALDTSNVSENPLFLYYTDGRADSRISAQKGAAGGLAELDGAGKVPMGQLPAIALNNSYAVADIAARDALTPVAGDVAIVADDGFGVSRSYVWSAVSSTWLELLTPLGLNLVKANNLSDVSNVTTARTNLGLGTGNSPTFTGLTLSTITSTGTLGITSGGANALTLDTGGAAALNLGTANATSIYLGRTGIAITVNGDFNISDYVDFNTIVNPGYSEGRLYYDDNLKTLSYFNDQAAVSVDIGQKNILRVKNQSGAPITYGEVVYITGATVAGIPTIALARADNMTTSKVLGFAAQNIASGSEGYVTAYGILANLNTAVYSSGDPIYLSPTVAGGMTATRPVQPNYEVPVGYIGKSGAADGTILAFVVPKPDTKLNVGGIPFGNASGLLVDDTANLFWDNATKRLGIGTNVPAYDLEVAGDIKAGDGSLFYLGAKTDPDPAGTNGSMYYNTSTNKFRCYENSVWKNCDTTGAIAADSLNFIDFSDSLALDASTSLDLSTFDLTTNGTGNYLVNNIGTAGLTPSAALTLTGGAASTWSTSAGALTLTSAAAATWGTAAGNLNLAVNGVSTGNVQIGTGGAGTVAPDYLALDVKSTTSDPAGGAEGYMYYNTADNKFRCYENTGWKDCDTSSSIAADSLNFTDFSDSMTLDATSTIGLNSFNLTTNGAGNYLVNNTGTAGLTPSAALTLTGGAASTWGTSAGDLTLQAASAGTTANVKIGIGGAGSATPDLLALDVQDVATGSGDPAGFNGAMYYNSVKDGGSFRCYEAGAWKACGSTAASATSLNQAYTAGNSITTAGNTPILFTLTAGNFNATGTGAVNLTPTAASQFTSVGALTLTGGATSTWGTTAGDLNLAVNGASTGNVQIGTGGAGTAAPDYLALDVKSTTSDPAGGAEGYMYYNTFDNKFRCYENSGWKDCDTSSSIAADSLNFTDFSDSLALDASTAINLSTFNLTTNGTGNYLVNNTGTAGITPSAALTLTGGAASTWSTSAGALTLTSAAAATWSTTAGNLTLQAGSGTVSLGTSTILNASGALTLNSGAAAALTIDSGTTGDLLIGTDASAETINVGSGAAVKTLTLGSINTTSTTIIQSGTGGIKLEVGGSGTTGNVQIGGTAGATPDLLILDTKNTAGQPSGTNGAMYYNSNENKFKCYEGASWKDCDTAGLSSLQIAYNNGSTIATSGGAAITFNTPIGSNNAGLVINQNNTTDNPVAFQITNAGTGNDITAANWSITKAGNISTSGNVTATGTGIITSAGTLTASNGLTMSTGALSLSSTSGLINLAGLTSTSIVNSGAITLTAGAASTISTTAGNITLQPAGAGTTAVVQIGTGGAGNTTPDFLALAVNSATGDPAGGAEGYMYYNTFDNKFRCYENTGWKDCDTISAGITSLANGGTNANLTASNGGIFYSTATAGAILAGTATSGQILRSGSTSAPSWSTATYPATAGTLGNVLTSDGTNWISSAPTAGSLSALLAATGANSINNGDNAQAWNWQLTTAAKTALSLNENAASTNGAGSQYILSAGTLAASTAAPLKVTARGNIIIDTTSTGGLTFGNTTANTAITLQSGTGAINIGADATAKTITIGNTTGATGIVLSAGTGGIKISGSANTTAIRDHFSGTVSTDIAALDGTCAAAFTITVTGAAVGDTVIITPTFNAGATIGIEDVTDSTWTGYVSAANTVTVRVCDMLAAGGGINPAAQTYRADVWQH